MLISVLSNRPLSKAVVLTSDRAALNLLPNQQLGFECEVEGVTVRGAQRVDGWVVKEDHSLRHGAEYVTDGVVTANKADVHLRKVLDYFRTAGAVLSVRTGFHMHVDVTDLTNTEMGAFTAAYLLCEDGIYRYAGEDREYLGFCVRLGECSDELENARAMTVAEDGRTFLGNVPPHERRYCGFNMASIPRLGTVEFRHLPMSFDLDYLLNFVCTILTLKKYVYGKSAQSVLEDFYAGEWSQRVLGNLSSIVDGSDMRRGALAASVIASVAEKERKLFDKNFFPIENAAFSKWKANKEKNACAVCSE
jgi:hypothetical protein